jgi:hypothetical protein
LLGDNVESGIGSIDPSEATSSDEFPCPDDYLDAPEDQIRCVRSLNHDVLRHLVRTRWDTSQCSDPVTDPWGPTGTSIELTCGFLPSNHYLRTFWACCDISPSGTLNLLRKIRIGTGQTITIPDETTVRNTQSITVLGIGIILIGSLL